MNENNMSFEQNLIRLEQIVRAMEKGDVALDASLKLFEEGTSLVRACTKLLDEAELKVTKVMAGENGPVEEAFLHDSDI